MNICSNWNGSTGALMEKTILSFTGIKNYSCRSPHSGPSVPGRALQELPDGDPEVCGPAVEPASPNRHSLVP